MHFYQLGKSSRPPLVLLHGWGLEGEKYRSLAKLLSSDYLVLVPDLPGFGKTDPPSKPYSVEDYSKKVKRWLKDEGITEAFFVGHSFGGRISIKLACKHPKLVKALVLTGTPGVEKFYWKRSLKRLLFWMAAKGLKLFSFLPQVQQWKKKFYEKRDFGKVEGVMKKTFLKVIREKLTKDAKKIHQKTLLVWGAKDQMTPVYDAEKMLKVIPHSYLKIYTRVGHKLPYEKPHEFAREITQFFEKIS